MKTTRLRAMAMAWRLALAMAAALTLASPPALAQDAVVLTPSQAIEARVSAVTTNAETTIRGQGVASAQFLENFYTQRAFEPAWTNSANVDGLLRAVGASFEEGLDPADYHQATLNSLRAEVAGAGATDEARADLDVLLTDAALRLGYHSMFGKVDPQRFDSQWNFTSTVAGLDPVAMLEGALATEKVYELLRSFLPAHPLYTGLRKELAHYRNLALRGGWSDLTAEQVPKDPSAVADPAELDLLRERLIATEDMKPDDTDVAAGVRAFQVRNGLAVDGKVGPATLAELNVPIEDRIRQLRINLDRGRVVLFQLPEEFLVVNVAAFHVFLVKGTDIVWDARAQVGKPYRATPLYRSDINYLVLNPTWTVPPGIIKNDILPAAKRDPNSITRKGLKVINSAGQVVSPSSVDWSRFNSGHIPYTLRQDPGPNNALGRVKFMFPNPYSVYLHDTPAQSLFEVDTRATSSGCVRVERALELADLLLHDQDQWNKDSIQKTIVGGKITNVTLKQKMPVMLLYWTAWVDAAGEVNFRRDVYGIDAKWGKALDERFQFRKQTML